MYLPFLFVTVDRILFSFINDMLVSFRFFFFAYAWSQQLNRERL